VRPLSHRPGCACTFLARPECAALEARSVEMPGGGFLAEMRDSDEQGCRDRSVAKHQLPGKIVDTVGARGGRVSKARPASSRQAPQPGSSSQACTCSDPGGKLRALLFKSGHYFAADWTPPRDTPKRDLKNRANQVRHRADPLGHQVARCRSASNPDPPKARASANPSGATLRYAALRASRLGAAAPQPREWSTLRRRSRSRVEGRCRGRRQRRWRTICRLPASR
jgi:hypothetical protein